MSFSQPSPFPSASGPWWPRRRLAWRARTLWIALAAVSSGSALLAAGLPGAERPQALPAPLDSPSASPASAAGLDATDLDALRAHLNQPVVVLGTPTATGHNKDGSVLYLNFGRPHQAIALVFFLKKRDQGSGETKAITEDDLKPFVGKAVTVRGQLTDYKGDLQIIVKSLEQLQAVP